MDIKILGTGGLAKELIGYIEGESNPRFNIVGCWADEDFNNSAFSHLYRGDTAHFIRNLSAKDNVIIAIASPRVRKTLVSELATADITFVTYIHPSCEISPYAKIGTGCILAPGVMVVGDAVLESHVFANTEVVIGHDSRVGSYTCIFPKVEICGDCNIGRECVFGINSVVLPGNSMADGSKLDAFSVLRDSTNAAALFSGNPAVPIKHYD